MKGIEVPKENIVKTKEHRGTIEKWQVAYQIIPMSIAMSPKDEIINVVVGEMYGFPIKTSKIISIVGNRLETENSIYTLGTPKINFKYIFGRFR